MTIDHELMTTCSYQQVHNHVLTTTCHYCRDPVEDVSSGSAGNSADDVDNLVPSIGSLQPQSVMDSIRDEDERRNQVMRGTHVSV